MTRPLLAALSAVLLVLLAILSVAHAIISGEAGYLALALGAWAGGCGIVLVEAGAGA
jgi:hypothetical protein